jgi:hypothetical protein
MRPGTTDKASAVAHYQAMAEQVARDQAEQLATRWRTPIPLPAPRSPIPTYGNQR